MGDAIPDGDRAWADERSRRLARMIEALDEDLAGVRHPDWLEFWEDMRRLYSRAAVYLATGARTGDRRCLRTGQELWDEIADLIDLAERRLGASG